MTVTGSYFAGGSSQPVAARAFLSAEDRLAVTDESGALLADAAIANVTVSDRLGRLRRSLELGGKGRFETDDNDGVDALLRAAGRPRRGTLLHRLESSLKWAVLSLGIAAASVFLMIRFGFPAIATGLAWATPAPVLGIVSNATLKTMDRVALNPTQLAPKDRQRAQLLFARVGRAARQGIQGYKLLLREGGPVGPNAFSLPDGRVILTDELYTLARRDDELEGVFGHEMAHADHRHVLQMIYEASLIPVAIALITGDASQFGQVAAVLPTMLIESSYSRAVEQQADDDSAATMKRIGADPAALADLLERLDKRLCGGKGCSLGWLGSHPATSERAARLRAESKGATVSAGSSSSANSH